MASARACQPTRFAWQRAASWGGANAAANQAAREAGQALVEHLLSLYARGKFTAKDLCITCYHAHHAGARGDVVLYAMN